MSALAHEAPAYAPPTLSTVVKRDDLVRGLNTVRTLAIPSRPQAPILGSVLITADAGVTRLRGFDYEREAAVDLEGSGTGVAAISAKRLLDIVRLMPKGGGVTLRVEGQRVEVSTADLIYRLPAYRHEQFPASPLETMSVVPVADLPAGDLAHLARVAMGAGSDYSLPVLTTVNLDAPDGLLTAAATNRYRLHAWTSTIRAVLPPKTSLMVPASLLTQASRLFDSKTPVVLGTVGDTYASLRAPGLSVLARTQDGTFPNWRSLIPSSDTPTVLTGDRAALSLGVQRAAVATERNLPVVLMAGGDNDVLLRTSTWDEAEALAGQVTLDMKRQGDAIKIGLNPGYFRQAVDAMPSERVRISIVAPRRPVVVREADSDAHVALVMPVSLPE
jgi:DNA polymerase-3 subunit beta